MVTMGRQGRGTRVARGAVAASVATFVALVAHVSSGAPMPGLFGVVVPLALSLVVCVVLAGRRVSAVRLSVAVALSQTLFHTLFVLGSFSAGSAAHVHGAPVAPALDVTPLAVSPDAAMWVGHAVAAVLTTAVLHRGEHTVTVLLELAARCVSWLRARARLIAVLFTPTPVRRVLAIDVAEVRPTSTYVVTSARRRGPPLAAS